MKIFVKDIGPNGLNLDEHLDPTTLDLNNQDFKCVSPIDVKAKVERIGDTILAKTQAKGTFAFVCSRCLESLERELKEDFYLDYKIDKTIKFIDLNDDIRQEMILAFPAVVLCSQECKGLCPGCGANLNNENCKCQHSGK